MKKTIQIKQGEKGLEGPSGFFQALEECGFEKRTDDTELIDVKNEMLAILKRIVDLELSRQGEINFPAEKDGEMNIQFEKFLTSYRRDNDPLDEEAVQTLQRFLSGTIPIEEVSYFHQSEFRNIEEMARVSRRFSNHRQIYYALEALRSISKIENLTKMFQESSSKELNEIIGFSIKAGRFHEKALTANLTGLAKTGGQVLQGGRKGKAKILNEGKTPPDPQIIFDHFESLSNKLPKMKRYEQTAKHFSVTTRWVQKIVAEKI